MTTKRLRTPLRTQRSLDRSPRSSEIQKVRSPRFRATRVRWLILLSLFAFFVLWARLYYWQVMRSADLFAEAQQQRISTIVRKATRGSILSADGYVLATNQDSFTVFVEPNKLSRSSTELASLLAPILAEASLMDEGSPSGTLESYTKDWIVTITQRLEKGRNWVALKHSVPEELANRILDLEITGVGLDRTQDRYYPDASIGAQLLGFVGKDSAGLDKGYFGIEGAFDLELQPSEGLVRRERDALGLPLPIGAETSIGAQHGRDIVLTIRRDYQYILEDELKKGLERYGSKTAEGIIMDPKTGEILAIAAYPSYDPAFFPSYDPSLYASPLLADVYEPGSTLKILTVAAGVDAGVVRPETRCTRCSGPRSIGGFQIKTWNDEYEADRTVLDGLIKSDNTVMIYIQEELGKERWTEYLKRFRLDQPTEIGLAEESTAPWRTTWRDIDYATSSFGQGIALNALQVLTVAQTIANQGVMLRPQIVKEVRDQELSLPVETLSYGEVISPQAAATVTQMMEQSVMNGDERWAVPKNIRIAGKTGTAQIAIDGGYDADRTVASFVGFAPADDPQFVMLIKLREPSSSPWGSETAAPLWFRVASRLLNK